MEILSSSYPSRRWVRPSWRILLGCGVAVLLIALLVGYYVMHRTTASTPASATVLVTRGPLSDVITGSGTIEPSRTAALAFTSPSGLVADVLVTEGDMVPAGASLVRLDTQLLAADVSSAQAVLAQAEADLLGVQDGATPAQVQAAQADVAAAQGTLDQVRGGVTPAAVQAAQLQVKEAQAKLAMLEGNPDPSALMQANAAIDQANTTLDHDQTTLSAAKTAAEGKVAASANALRDTQTAYAQARADHQRVIDHKHVDPHTGAPLTDAARQIYIDQEAIAERKMQDADSALAQAQVDYDTAKQDEITGLAQDHTQQQKATIDRDALLHPGSDAVAAARTQLATANAQLAQLTGEQRRGALAAQASNVTAAQAKLADVSAGPKRSDLARAEARVTEAKAQLNQAQTKLDQATLKAPFAGLVTNVAVVPGESLGTGAPVTLSDITQYVVKLTIDEVDIARVVPGQQVDVTVDALGGAPLVGTVLRVAPQPQAQKTVTAYQITVGVNPAGRPVKPGMTISSRIVVAHKADALSLPTTAIHTNQGASVVQLVTTAADGTQTITTQPITIGAHFGNAVEVTSGVHEGQRVVTNAS